LKQQVKRKPQTKQTKRALPRSYVNSDKYDPIYNKDTGELKREDGGKVKKRDMSKY
jgi:hypothetical protein